MITATLATVEDVDPWLELAIALEPLFGPMPNFADHIVRGIGRGTAWVAQTNDGGFTGGMLLSRPGAPQRINWLGVLHTQRRQGSGGALLRAALNQWPSGTISLDTFTADEPAGQAARRLYERHDFVCKGPAPAAPDGTGRDLFELTR